MMLALNEENHLLFHELIMTSLRIIIYKLKTMTNCLKFSYFLIFKSFVLKIFFILSADDERLDFGCSGKDLVSFLGTSFDASIS